MQDASGECKAVKELLVEAIGDCADSGLLYLLYDLLMNEKRG